VLALLEGSEPVHAFLLGLHQNSVYVNTKISIFSGRFLEVNLDVMSFSDISTQEFFTRNTWFRCPSYMFLYFSFCYSQQLGKAQKLGGLFVACGGLADTLLDEADPIRAQSHLQRQDLYPKFFKISKGLDKI